MIFGTVFQTAAHYAVIIPRLRPGLLSLRSVLSSRQVSLFDDIMNCELKNYSHPFPHMVSVAILVVDDGDEATMIRHTGEEEVIP